jgi:transcriptional antiterminator NusG
MSEIENEQSENFTPPEIEADDTHASIEEGIVDAGSVKEIDLSETPQAEELMVGEQVEEAPMMEEGLPASDDNAMVEKQVGVEETEDTTIGEEELPSPADEATLDEDTSGEESSAEEAMVLSAVEFESNKEATLDEVEEELSPAEEAGEVDETSVPEDESQDLGLEEPILEEDDDDRLWYVVHCYSGYENKVRHNLEQRIETMGMKNKIYDVVVPTEEEIEIKDGRRRTVERRVFPGYILVQMIMDEDSWYVVRNTPGVTGFVGMGNEPTPLRPEEVSQIVKRMEAEAPRIKVAYKPGQKVRIIDGPFNDFIGTVSDINMERAKVRVMVSFFGRETPVELDFLQVEKS